MIRITNTFALEDHTYEERFVTASGPGGQNVNKVATAVQLRLNLDALTALPEDVKLRLRKIAYNQITKENILIVEASSHRTQERNRKAAQRKLANLIRKALKPPKKRKKTKPTKASQEKRLKEKRIHSRKKNLRQNPPYPD